ncbi:hypothetical protein NDU88_005156 [Pleurodeles waltl]|uniref:Uncharacterized protein n=1 Tax=Pleurodeles waltl TaxID=8319 RepID=A0AAV7VKX9_PLEWA|nr:hypothetical protein NDU88_005156 [Pleurodeles waltl]
MAMSVWVPRTQTVETTVTDPEGVRAAAANLQMANAEVERVLKPLGTERGGEEFSSGGEDGAVQERWKRKPEQTPGE